MGMPGCFGLGLLVGPIGPEPVPARVTASGWAIATTPIVGLPAWAFSAEPGPEGAAPTPEPALPPPPLRPGRIVDHGRNSSVNATISATATATDVRSPNAGRAESAVPLGKELSGDDPPLASGWPSPRPRCCMCLPSARGRAG